MLDAATLAVVQRYFKEESSRQMRWVDGPLDELLGYKSAISKILSRAACMFDLSTMVGVEQWAHYGTKPNWHVDKDETLSERTGQLAYPLCSIVFYAEVTDLTGGRFMTEDMTVTPKTNRIVAFAPGILHGVEDFTGTRLSVAVNPWAVKPQGY